MFLPASDVLSTTGTIQQDPVDILRITRLSVAALQASDPGTGNFRGYFRALPTATSWNMNDFAIMMAPGTTTLSTTAQPIVWSTGDLMIWNQTAWTWYPVEEFENIQQFNGPTYQGVASSPQYPIGAISSWSQQPGRIGYQYMNGSTLTQGGFSGQVMQLYSGSSNDTAMKVEYSCIPVGDIGNITLNISDEARDAIVNCCLVDLLNLPGDHQNMYMAMQKKQEYEQQKAALAALGVLGMGASGQYTAPSFTPNNGRFWPYYFQPFLPGR